MEFRKQGHMTAGGSMLAAEACQRGSTWQSSKSLSEGSINRRPCVPWNILD